MMNKAYSNMASFLVGFGVILSSMTATADNVPGDGKVYSGLGCTEVPDGIYTITAPDPYGANDVRYTSPGWAYNSSFDHSIIIACPIVRERVTTPMKRAWVTVLNETESEVTCQIEAFDEKGTYVEESTWMLFGKSQDGYPETRLVSNDPDDEDAWPNGGYAWAPQLKTARGYYVLFCVIPPMTKSKGDIDGAYVVRYEIEESY
jgi:hypothetical protein